MARYLFLTWNGAGNQSPAIGIAQALRDRSHDVVFGGYESQRSLFTRRGFRFTLLKRSAAAWRDEPPERMFAVKMQTVWASSEHLDDVPQAISEEHCDVLVVDCLMFGALVAAEVARVPTAVLVHSVPGALFPAGGQFEAALRGLVNRVRAVAGRAPINNMWEAWAPFPAICNSIPQLDPLAGQGPASLDYVGPIVERVPPSEWHSPWAHGDGRPLVLVSFSTGPYWDQSSRIRRTLQALADCDCRVLVTAGGADVTAIEVPANAVIAGHLPHAEVLPHASLTITHAGHGTVIASLMHGVPLLCLPNAAADQPALAAQVQALGAGRALDGDRATPGEIAAAVDDILSDPAYAAAARLLADAIADAPGVSAAACQLEQLTPAHQLVSARVEPNELGS